MRRYRLGFWVEEHMSKRGKNKRKKLNSLRKGPQHQQGQGSVRKLRSSKLSRVQERALREVVHSR